MSLLQEDEILRRAVALHDGKNWRKIGKQAAALDGTQPWPISTPCSEQQQQGHEHANYQQASGCSVFSTASSSDCSAICS